MEATPHTNSRMSDFHVIKYRQGRNNIMASYSNEELVFLQEVQVLNPRPKVWRVGVGNQIFDGDKPIIPNLAWVNPILIMGPDKHIFYRVIETYMSFC
jgi:hypothetical protein